MRLQGSPSQEEDFEEDVGIYEELNLDAEEANFRVVGEEPSDDEESDAEGT